MRKYKAKHLSLVLIALFSVMLLSCGVSKTLTLSTFGDATENHHMQCVDYTPVTAKGMSRWIIAEQSGATCNMQYIEFANDSSATTFYNEQKEYIQELNDANGSTLSGGGFYLNSNGFFYYVGVSGNKVVLATAKNGDDAENIKAALREIPEIPVDF